eukprot:4174311-Alexandrium_andersonii.AAC.1
MCGRAGANGAREAKGRASGVFFAPCFPPAPAVAVAGASAARLAATRPSLARRAARRRWAPEGQT